jgi:YidC/Oxa1 family membrane protein insertase
MAEMQKLAPKMQEIREKHAGDKEKMQQEMAKIGGFKAFGGCLPMFIQMPIWIALYSALGVAIQLRHAAFLPPSWLPPGSMFLQDLSGPDALVHWTTPAYLPGTDIPLLGWLIGSIQGMLVGGPGGLTSFNLLPILMGVSMYLQQRMTPTPVAAGPQAQQQKTMMVFMTFFMALVLYSAPSGLNLYIATSTFLGFFEQRYLKKKMEEARAARESQVPDEVKPGAPAKEQLLAASRHQSLIERLRVWADNRARKAKQTEAGRPGTPKSKRGR